jgi:hypothetical protein
MEPIRRPEVSYRICAIDCEQVRVVPELNEFCALLGFHAPYICGLLPTFWENLCSKFGFGFPVRDMSSPLSWSHVFGWILMLRLQCALFYFTDVGRVCVCFVAYVIREVRASYTGYIANICVVVFSYICIYIYIYVCVCVCLFCQSQWSRSPRRSSAAARLLRLWFRIPPGAWCLSVVIVVCCQVEVSATSWSLIQRSATECVVSLCVIQKPRDWATEGCYVKKYIFLFIIYLFSFILVIIIIIITSKPSPLMMICSLALPRGMSSLWAG